MRVVPINVLCPHCESRFNVQDDLLGKQMRCPACMEIFTVEPAAETLRAQAPVEEVVPANDKPGASRADAPAPTYKSGSITEFLEMLSTEAAAPHSNPSPVLGRGQGGGLPELIPADAALVDDDVVFGGFEIVEDQPAKPKKKKKHKEKLKVEAPLVPEVLAPPKEFVWSEQVAPPGPPPSAIVPPKPDLSAEPVAQVYREGMAPVSQPDELPHEEPPAPDVYHEEEFIRPRKKRGRLVILIFLILVVFGGTGTGGYFLKRYLEGAPERLYVTATKEYKEGHYEPAKKLFEELVAQHPDNPHVTEARFLVELCTLRSAIYSVAVRADPAPAQRQLDKFLKVVEDPAMKPFVEVGRFDVDVWETALKLLEEVAGRANEVFNREKPDEVIPWLEQSVSLGEIVNRFRRKELEPENIYTQIDGLRKKIADARSRLGLIAETTQELADADDNQIVAVRQKLDDRGFATDPAFVQLLDAAERRIADRVEYKRLDPPIASRRDRTIGSTGILFAPRLDTPSVRQAPPAGPTTVFFALARGVLYALDESDGHVLWAARIGIDSDIPPLYIPGTDLNPELVIVVANDGARSTLTALLARTGDNFWQQPLPTACLGGPVLVGQRVFVPLHDKPTPKGERQRRDEVGVILEIEIGDGSQIGRISLGRPLGSGALRRPGTGQIFFPAESKGVYVFDVEKSGAEGARLDPAFQGILPTAHVAGSLRGEPIIAAGDGDSPSYLILGITEGLDSMKLRAFPLSLPDRAPAIVGDLPPPIPLIGWTWFPPYADAEKLAVVTDRGEFGLFGIKQTGNLDTPIFVLPPDPYSIPDARAPARGQVVYADEESMWFLARGALHCLRIGFDAERGLKLVPRGKPLPLGEPLQAAQINLRGDTALVVTQASASASSRATAIDLRTGGIRWQRQLGMIAQGDPIRIGEMFLMMDHDGGLYQFDAKPLAGPTNAEWLIDERWLVVPPFAQSIGTGHFLRAKDGQSVYTILTIPSERGPRLAIRQYTPGQPLRERFPALPAPLAGNPIVVGTSAIVPLANGMLYRLPLDSDKPMEAGPTWRGEKINVQATCHLAELTTDEFLASDGHRTLNRWRWSSDRDEFARRGTVTLSERIAAPPVVLVGMEDLRVIVADVKCNVTLWDADRLTANAQPQRTWRPSAKGPIPIGPLTNGPFLINDARGKPRIGYVIDGVNLVWLSPQTDGPLWVSNRTTRIAGDGIVGKPILHGDRVYVTDRNGHYRVLDAETGATIGAPAHLRGSAAPAAPALPIDRAKLLAPLSDGTILLLPISEQKPEKLPFIIYALPPFGIPVVWPVE